MDLVSVATVQSRRLPESIPDGIDSPTGKLVYFYLATAGRTSVEEMATHLDEPKLTLYGVLSTLATREVVERVEGGYRLA